MNQRDVLITDAYPPVTDDLSEEWFGATAEGRLLIQRCTDCGKPQFYPRRICVHCGSREVAWLVTAGMGRLHTFSVVHRTPNQEFAPLTPYVLAIVELEEGPRMTANILDIPHEDLRCDMPLRVTFPTSPDSKYVFPCFTSAEAT